MRLIIAGGRNIKPSTSFIYELVEYHFNIPPAKVEYINGGAKGVDSQGKEMAEALGAKSVTFEANWSDHGKAAGPIRNREMAEYAAEVEYGALLLIWDGKSRGSASMKREAERASLYIAECVLTNSKAK